jgi:hypothetical protein
VCASGTPIAARLEHAGMRRGDVFHLVGKDLEAGDDDHVLAHLNHDDDRAILLEGGEAIRLCGPHPDLNFDAEEVAAEWVEALKPTEVAARLAEG